MPPMMQTKNNKMKVLKCFEFNNIIVHSELIGFIKNLFTHGKEVSQENRAVLE